MSKLVLECASCANEATFVGADMNAAMDKAGAAGWALQMTHPRRATCGTCGEKLLAEYEARNGGREQESEEEDREIRRQLDGRSEL